ncbi:MAG: hypothetical protein JNL57_00575 [Bacteroidetes bacterium]|nr:hypothetical protein [Bacteroidota bacterium]
MKNKTLSISRKIHSLILILFCLTAGQLYSQSTNPAVEPGKAAGTVKIGAPVSDAIAFCGKPQMVKSKEAEDRDWRSGGYNPDKEFVFQLMWDSVYVFESENNKYAIWKVYTVKGKIVLMNLAFYSASKESIDGTKTTGNIGFGAKPEEVTGIFGLADITLGENKVREDSKDLFYGKKGIAFLIDSEGLSNMLVFKKLNKKAIKKINKKLK